MQTSLVIEPDSLESSWTDKDLQAVKDVIASFLILIKNYGIYPHNHAICRQSIENATARLNNFLKSHDRLRLDVEKNQLLYMDEPVHIDPLDGEKPAFLLFRDGIQWVEFHKDLEPFELATFVRILTRYKALLDESEGDLVTALWEADLSHLRYEAADLYWESEPVVDLSTAEANETRYCGTGELDSEPYASGSIAHQSKGPSPSKLTNQEVSKLRQIISEEEGREFTESALDVAFLLLTDRPKERDFEALLKFLEDEFRNTLGRGRFRYALRLLRGLKEFGVAHGIEKPWILPILEDFFRTIATPSVLGVLSAVWRTLDTQNLDRIRSLCQVLLHLPPEAILSLAPMLPQIPSAALQRQLVEVIGIMAKRDFRLLEELLDRPEESLVQKLIDIIGPMEGEKPLRVLLRMIHHPSERVRKKVLRYLVVRYPQSLGKIFHLIEDPSEAVRGMLLEHLGQSRNELAEGVLLDYLSHRRFKITNHEHLAACYRVLGQCGSSLSIPFLRGTLFDRGWMPGFGRSVHRRGAVIALMTLGNEDSKNILERASKSIMPSIRLAYRKAVEAHQPEVRSRT
jgi:hypothetical protein